MMVSTEGQTVMTTKIDTATVTAPTVAELEEIERQVLQSQCDQEHAGRAAVQAKFDALPSKSAKIKFLARNGMKRAVIAKTLNLRYQFVRNVLEQAGIPKD